MSWLFDALTGATASQVSFSVVIARLKPAVPIRSGVLAGVRLERVAVSESFAALGGRGSDLRERRSDAARAVPKGVIASIPS